MPYFPPASTAASEAGTLKYVVSNAVLTGTLADIPSLTWALGVGTFEFAFDAVIQASGNPQPTLGYNYTGTFSASSVRLLHSTANSGAPAGWVRYISATPPISLAYTVAVSAGATTIAVFSGMLTTATAGTFTFQASNPGTGTATVLAGTFGKVSLS